MRGLLTAACLAALAAISFTTSASASNGHWVCTGDGIKSWTSDMGAKDASGWKYEGADRTSYKDAGKCSKG
ncbi:MAG: hypothetical protein ISS15_13670 [Alphaproteobacteria bacterium]|nr:hypothetical protein [Alphaproteobacteria bacterium]MBL6936247.1 hypothetical protein [Alphaproteobacteria bacterium]MBL7098702.1 hypothetical protein [Alphaproteobacteria bacterium]